jgi:hypothetical protein
MYRWRRRGIGKGAWRRISIENVGEKLGNARKEPGKALAEIIIGGGRGGGSGVGRLRSGWRSLVRQDHAEASGDG